MAKRAGKGGGNGPSKEDVTIAAQMAGLISQMASQSSKISASFESQAEATAKMAENMKSMGTGDIVTQLLQVNVTLKEVLVALQGLNATSAATFAAMSEGAAAAAGATNDLSQAVDEIETTALEDLQESFSKTGKNALTAREKFNALGKYLENEFPVAAGAALGAMSGLAQSFKNVMALGQGMFGIGKAVVSSLFSIGKSIISLPFKMLDKLTGMANQGGAISELATATNNLRKEFGALGGPVASAVQSTAREMKGFNVQGLSSMKVFGNVAERMEQLTKLFAAGGPSLQKFSGEFETNGGAILGFQKGLGITDEQLGALAERADTAGTSISSSLLDMTKQATHLGAEFGVDFKVISKGMAKATADFKNFGSMSQKQIGVAVTYFAKLGVQLDKVTGVMDSFNTFDDASEKVSTLNQVFGTNIDSMKMMNAENPAERLSMLQKEFAKAGISGEKLTRAQRQLIASNTGISEDAVAQAFASKNQSVSLDKMTKAGEKAAKTEMTQAQALNKLGDAMDRVLKAGESKSGGFFDQFLQGVEFGITSSKEFREIMKNLKASLMTVFLEGKRLGLAFIEHFPGVKQFMEGLADLFQPAKFKKLAGGIVDIFIGFFKDLESGKASFPDLMERLKKHFFDFFNTEKGAGQKLMGGFGKIMMAIQVILAGGVEWIMKTMSGFIVSIVNFIKNPTTVPGVGGMTDAAGNYLSPIAQAFLNGWAVLGPALKDLFAIVFDKMLGIVKEKMEEHKWKIALLIFGPVLTRALLGAGTAMIGKAIGSAITAAMGTPAIAAASSTVTQSITSLATGAVTTATVTTETAAVAAGPTIFARIASKWSGLTSGLAKTLGPNLLKAFKFAGIAAVVADAAINISSAMDKFDDKLQKEGFDPSTRKIAAGTVGLINTLTLGLLPEDLQASIATGVAKMSNFLEESLDKMFGPSLANSMKERLAATFQIFGGLGDLIMGLWNGDSAKVEKGILAIGEGILKALFYAFEFLYIELPKLILQLGVYLIEGFYRLQAWLIKKLATIFHALENIPIFGPLFGLIGDLLDKISGAYTYVADMFGKLQSILKKVDIAGWAMRGFDALKNLFKGGASEGNGFFSKLFGWWKTLVAVIEEPYRLLRKIFNIIFSWDTGKSFLENLKDKWDAIVGAFNESADKITNLFDKIFSDISDAWNWVSEKAGKAIDWIAEKLNVIIDPIVSAFNWIKTKVNEVYQFIKTAWDVVWSKLEPAFHAISLPFQIVYNIIKTIFEAIYEEIIQPIFGKIVDFASYVIDQLSQGWANFKAFVVPIFEAIKSAWDASIGWIVEKAKFVMDQLSQGWANFKAFVVPIFEAIKSAWNASIGWIVEKAKFVMDQLSQGWTNFKNMVMPIIDAISEKVSSVYNFFADIFNKIWNMLTGWADRLVAWGDRILATLTEPGVKAKDRLINAFNEIWAGITSILSWEKFKQLGSDILDGLLGGLGAIGTKIKEKFSGAVDGVKDFLGINSPSTEFADMGGNMVDGLMNSFTEMPKRLKEKFLEAIQNLDALVKEIGTAVTNLVIAAVSKITEMFDAIIDGPIKTFPPKVEKAIVDIVGVVDRSFTVITQSVRINFNKVYDIVVEITDKIMSYFETNVPRGIAIFKNLRDGILDLFGLGSFGKIFDDVILGIQVAMGKLADFGPFKAVLDIAKKVFKTGSKSKAMEAIGNDVVLGMDVAMANLPKKAEAHFDATLAKAENFSNDMSAVAPGAQGAAVAPSSAPTASGPAPAAGAAVTDVVSQIAELGKAAAGAAEAHKKIAELNNVAGLISAELLKFSILLPYIVDPLKSMFKLIKAGAGEIAVGEMVKQFTGLLTGLSELGDVGRKIKDENLALKIYDLNMAAGDPTANDGLQYHLHRTPEWWDRIIVGAKGIETLFKDSPAEKLTKTITDFTSFISALSSLGDVGRKIKDENLALKIYDLNMAAGDSAANDGLQYMMSRIPYHWRPIAEHAKTVHAFFSKEFSIAGLTETMNLTKTTMKGVSSAMTGATGPTLQAMSDMATALVAIDEAVSKTKNINLSATLKTFKTNFGMALGQKGSHVVSAKDVIINVSFVVAIDATKLEGAILSGNSKIKEKINLVIGAVGEMPAADVGLEPAGPTSKFKTLQAQTANGTVPAI